MNKEGPSACSMSMVESSGGYMNKTEKKKFKKLLLAKRSKIVGSVSTLRENALSSTESSSSGGSRMPTHMADVGSDHFEREFTLGLIENEEDVVRQIDGALERLKNDKFGICEECEGTIPKARMEAIPFAKLCITCQEEEERNPDL